MLVPSLFNVVRDTVQMALPKLLKALHALFDNNDRGTSLSA
jgi:hypothetical protein